MNEQVITIKPKSEAEADPVGFIHSIDTGSMVDGPGMRLVFFLSGCSVHCSFCHNPDTWHLKNGTKMRLSEVLSEVDRYATFLRAAKGGVTISGGEPLIQAPFVAKLIKELKIRNLHVTLETSGNGKADAVREIISLTDLFIVDVKGFSAETYKTLTDHNRDAMINFCKEVAHAKRPLWLSLVLIRGVTTNPEVLQEMAHWAHELGNVERVLVRPLHLFGNYKWEKLAKDFLFKESDVPSAEEVAAARKIFSEFSL